MDKPEVAVTNLEVLAKEEEAPIPALSRARAAAEIIAIFSGHSYSSTRDKK